MKNMFRTFIVLLGLFGVLNARLPMQHAITAIITPLLVDSVACISQGAAFSQKHWNQWQKRYAELIKKQKSLDQSLDQVLFDISNLGALYERCLISKKGLELANADLIAKYFEIKRSLHEVREELADIRHMQRLWN